MTLTIELHATGDMLRATYTNRGTTPLALTFWWNRSMIVHDATGAQVTARNGPRLPCGITEDHVSTPPPEPDPMPADPDPADPGEHHDDDDGGGCNTSRGGTGLGLAFALLALALIRRR